MDGTKGLVSRIDETHNAPVNIQWLTAPLDVDRIGMRISIASFNNENEVGQLIDALQ